MNLTLSFRTWGVSLYGGHQWHPLLDKLFPKKGPPYWNWIDITLIKLEFEHSPYKNSNEVGFALLGFTGCITVWRAFEPRTEGRWIQVKTDEDYES